MDSITLEIIQRRRAEVGKQLSHLNAMKAELESELGDLDATERTFARMGGGERRPASAPIQRAAQAKTDATKPATSSEMILQVFNEMKRGMEPREVTDAIEAKGWGPVNRDAMRTRIWHLAKDGKLLKDGSVYSLPATDAETNSSPEASGEAHDRTEHRDLLG